MNIRKWDIFEELKNEEDIQAFVEASMEEAANDTDPGLLAHALGVAAKARAMLPAIALSNSKFNTLPGKSRCAMLR
jgi:probable addiction module antidote protein